MDKQLRTAPDTVGTAPAEPAQPTPNERVAKTTAPKPRHDVGLAWLVLLGLVVLAAIPLGVELHRPAVWTEAEALAVAISAETHRRKSPAAEAETSLEKWTPVYEGVSRWDLPPGGVWLHQVFLVGLDAQAAGDDRALVMRTRIASAVMMLLLIASVYWAGHSIGGVGTGALGAFVAMTMPLVVGFGRVASIEVGAIAWSTLSIAAALWAMRPLRATPSLARQLIGWLVSGLGLALATLTAGPTAIPATLLCTVALAMVCPRRLGHVMGLVASMAFAALLITPWVLHVHDHDADVWRRWAGQLAPDLASISWLEALRRAGWRVSLAAAYSGLWLIWLIPAVTQPFSTSTGSARRRMLLGWVWLAVATALLAFAPGKTRLAGLLLAVAPASVAIGLVIQQFHDLSAEARHARLWLVCRWIACLVVLALSLALPAAAFFQTEHPQLVDWLPSTERALLPAMHWSYYAGAAVALLLASVLAMRFALGNHPGRTTACLALWLVITYTLVAIAVSRGPLLSTAAAPPPGAAPATTSTATLP